MAGGELRGSRIGAILRATSGNFLEQFDFFLFGFYATAISRAFFPSDNETTALLNTFGVFWLGALMRPIGAVVLGAYLDRLGRRQGLILTLSIMASGTVLIAISPTYAQIGILAPIIVIVGRLLQGFSAGVELGGVSIYLFEIAKPNNKGFLTAFQSGSQQVSIFIAAIIGFGLSEMMSPAVVNAWGWRIPFFIGCLMIPFIFAIRRSLEETPDFLARKTHPTAAEVMSSMLANIRIVLLGMMLVTLTTVFFYFITVYTPTFGKTVLKLGERDALIVTVFVAVSNFIWLPIGGAISDRIGRRPVLLAMSVLGLVTAYPLLSWLIADVTFTKLLLVELVLSFYYGVYNGVMVVSLSEIVPPAVRATAFSLAYALAAALFGTFTPFASTWLINSTHNRASPAYWLMAAAAMALVATLVVYRKGSAAAAATA